MIRIQNRAFALVAAGLLALPGTVSAFGNGTPDGQPPAEEVICDPNVGLRGAAYGLCVAYCEANDCDGDPEQHACEVILGNFHRITGRTDVPCVVISDDTPR